MSYMNWIYSMIADNTYSQFKYKYEKAIENNNKEFTWDGKPMRVTFAKYVCILVDKHLMQEYDEHLEQQVIMHESYLNDPINY